MVDLSPLNRLTLKRNMLLQKQLDVQLRIMTEEYRMTKKDLEKSCKDVGGFLMYLHHTAPGLGSYGQPDTRAMNAKNMIKYRLAEQSEDNETKKAKALLLQQQKKGDGKTSGDKTEGTDNEDRPPSRTNRNEFFNKRIVLDAKRRSFMKNSMLKDAGGKPTSSSDPREDLRRAWGTPTNRTGFLSNRDTQGEASSKKRPHTSPPTNQRPRTARYGSDAYSEQDENIRKEILGRFNFIFDPQNVKPEGRLRRQGLAATPIAIPKSDATGNHDSNPTTGPSSSSLPPKYILNRRVAWSAPPKRRDAPNDMNSNSNHPPHPPPNRQAMSVTPRSGTAHLNNHRCSSASTATMRDVREMAGEAAEVKQIIESQMKKRNPQRPKTAPPVYQLMQRNVAAPRQQVAGILAEIQSRTADTRAMLMKSKQLKKMVKSLAPDDVNEDEYSD